MTRCLLDIKQTVRRIFKNHDDTPPTATYIVVQNRQTQQKLQLVVIATKGFCAVWHLPNHGTTCIPTFKRSKPDPHPLNRVRSDLSPQRK